MRLRWRRALVMTNGVMLPNIHQSSSLRAKRSNLFRKASCQGLLRRRRLAMTGYGDSMPVKRSFFIDQAGSGEFSISLVRILFSFILSTYLSTLPEANQKPGTRHQKPDTRNQTPETRHQKPETKRISNKDGTFSLIVKSSDRITHPWTEIFDSALIADCR